MNEKYTQKISEFKDGRLYKSYKYIKNKYIENRFGTIIELFCCLFFAVLIGGYFGFILSPNRSVQDTFYLSKAPYYFITSGKLIGLFTLFLSLFLWEKASAIFGHRYEKDTERNFEKSKTGHYGTSEIMKEVEKEETFHRLPIEEQLANFIGSDPDSPNLLCSLKPRYGLNENKVTVAGPGGAKTTTINMNDLFQIIRRGESAYVTDPKGELARLTAELAKHYGYLIRFFIPHPDYMINSDCCHFLKAIKNAKTESQAILMAQQLADSFIQNTLDGERKDYWAKNEQSLLTGEILRVSFDDSLYENEKTIGNIYRRTTTLDANGYAADYANLKLRNPDHPALYYYNTFANCDKTVQSQIINGLSIRLQLFGSDIIQTITGGGGDEIDFTLPGKQKCIYYIITSDQTQSMSFLSAMFFTLAFQELVSYADRFLEQRLPVKTWMILEEFYNCGIIPDFPSKISTLRSRGIPSCITVQNLNQLMQMYPDLTWESVMDCCDIFLLLKTNTKTTMDYFSYLTGIETIFMKNRRYVENELDPLKIHLSTQVTEGMGQRAVCLPNDVRTMSSKNKIMCITSGHNVVFFDKFHYSKHPLAKEIVEIHPAEHYPRYRLIQDGIVDEFFDYDKEPTIRMPIEYEDDKYYAEYKNEKYNPERRKKKNVEKGINNVKTVSSSLTNGSANESNYIIENLAQLTPLKQILKKQYPESVISFVVDNHTKDFCQVTAHLYENSAKDTLLEKQTAILFYSDYRHFKRKMGESIESQNLTLKETTKKLALYTLLAHFNTTIENKKAGGE